MPRFQIYAAVDASRVKILWPVITQICVQCIHIQSISRRQKKELSDFLIINISLDNFHENKKPVIFLKSDTAAEVL